MYAISNKIKNYCILLLDNNSDYILSFLFGMLGAVIIFMLAHFMEKSSVQLGTVNVTGMVNHFVKQESNKNISPEQLKAEVTQFGDVLEKEVSRFSKEKGLVLMISEAVASGVPDYTDMIYQRIQQKREKHDE